MTRRAWPLDEACEFAIDPALTLYYDPFSFFERPSHQDSRALQDSGEAQGD
jgi:hypothetical protein